MVHCKLHVLRRCNQCPLWNFISLSLCRIVRYHYNTIFSLDHFLFAISYSIYWKYWKYWICVVLKYFVHILFTIQFRVRVYGSLFASPFVTICVCESNANKIMSCLCTSILRKATEIVESKEKLSKYPVMYAVGAVLIIMGCVVEENRIFHFCRPLHPLAPHSLVWIPLSSFICE